MSVELASDDICWSFKDPVTKIGVFVSKKDMQTTEIIFTKNQLLNIMKNLIGNS